MCTAFCAAAIMAGCMSVPTTTHPMRANTRSHCAGPHAGSNTRCTCGMPVPGARLRLVPPLGAFTLALAQLSAARISSGSSWLKAA